MEKEKKVTISDIAGAIRQIPATVGVLNKVDGGLFKLLVFFSIITGLLPVVSILITQNMINSIVDVENRSLNRTIQLVVVFIIYNVVSYILGEINSYVTTIYQYRLQYGLQYRMMKECSKMELNKFETAKTYDTVEKLTTEIAYRPFQMFMGVISMFTSFMSFFSVLIVLFLWSKIASFVMLIVPVVAVFYYLKIGYQEFDMMWNRAGAERKLWYYNYLMTHDFSFKEIKVLNLAEYLLDKYKKKSDEFVHQNKTILRKKITFNVFYGTVVYLISGGVIGLSLYNAYVGTIFIGDVMGIIRSVSTIQSSTKEIMANLYIIYSCSLYMKMLQDFLKENREDNSRANIKLNTTIEDIAIDNVSYSYDNQNMAIKDVSLRLRKGERVAIVGPNGSGKSTLLKLIIGLYKPQSGSIKINGIESKDIDIDSYYERMSVLFQDFVKYELSVRENIGFGDVRNINDSEKIQESLKNVGVNFLESEEGKVDLKAQLGNWFENGRELSQGQWQKIALSRIYMKNADCYMLDEPNAALDTLSEKDAFNRFFELSEDKVGVYISHRLCAAKQADEIVVMNNGSVVAIGTHDRLMEECSVYRQMYDAERYGEVG